MGIRIGIAALTGLALGIAACGGGRTAIVGIGNSGNGVSEGNEVAREIGKLLVETGVAPQVDDALLSEIYASFVTRARRGDSEAALVILEVANEQRREE